MSFGIFQKLKAFSFHQWPKWLSSHSRNEVIFERVNNKGIITLNRPKALNAINMRMAKEIKETLKEWERCDFAIIKGNENVFSTGGDMRAGLESVKKRTALYKEFFAEKYKMYYQVGKGLPLVALMDGLALGTGVALSVSGRYRVVTENSILSMPEAGIGFYPDLGQFWAKLGNLGTYLTLTGQRLKGSDILKSGIATHMCNSSMLKALEQDLLGLRSREGIDDILKKYQKQCPDATKPFGLRDKMNEIEAFGGESIEEIISRLGEINSEFSIKTVKKLLKMSPSSLKVTLKLLQMADKLSLKDSFRMEYRVYVRCCESFDAPEGFRAFLSKEQPKWEPKTLEAVTPDIVEGFFAPLPSGQELQFD